MSDPNTIREAVEHDAGWLRSLGESFVGWDDITAIHDAALAYADSLDDPIWWCFEHEEQVEDIPERAIADRCRTGVFLSSPDPCDIAKATRPRRIE